MSIQKTIFVVTVQRGRRTRFFYGERLKDALGVAGLKIGDAFQYAKFSRGTIADARLVRSGVYETT